MLAKRPKSKDCRSYGIITVAFEHMITVLEYAGKTGLEQLLQIQEANQARCNLDLEFGFKGLVLFKAHQRGATVLLQLQLQN